MWVQATHAEAGRDPAAAPSGMPLWMAAGNRCAGSMAMRPSTQLGSGAGSTPPALAAAGAAVIVVAIAGKGAALWLTGL